MSKQIGRAWVFSDDVDTDLIYHNKYLAAAKVKRNMISPTTNILLNCCYSTIISVI